MQCSIAVRPLRVLILKLRENSTGTVLVLSIVILGLSSNYVATVISETAIFAFPGLPFVTPVWVLLALTVSATSVVVLTLR